MIQINLRNFYPECYKSDCFVEVPHEVAELLTAFKRTEQSRRRRIYKNKAHYSLDAYEMVEWESLSKGLSAADLYERAEDKKALFEALMRLTDGQRVRVYQHFFLNMSYTAIAEREGVDASAVRKSVLRALRQLRKNHLISP